MSLLTSTRTRLARKYFLLLLIPLLVQIIPLVTALCLQRETDAFPRRAQQDVAITDAYGCYARDALGILHLLKDATLNQRPVEPRCDQLFESFLKDSKHLDELLLEFPSLRTSLLSPWNERITPEVRKNLENERNGLAGTTGSVKMAFESAKQASVSATKEQSFRTAFANLLAAREAVSQFLAAHPCSDATDSESQVRAQQIYSGIAIGVTAIDILIVVGLGILFSVDFLRRLEVMRENTVRLVADEPLNAPVPGSDELAALDGIFHEVASFVKETIRSHKAVIENAQDMIISIDEEGQILSVNPAVCSLLGFSTAELHGRWFLEILTPDEEVRAVANISRIIKGGQDLTFDTRALRKDKTAVDLQISAHWSAFERAAILIARDVTLMKAAERFQQEVIQLVSHDLRSPLTIMAGFHGLLRAGVLGQLTASGAERTDLASRSADRMLSIINDLLDAEKMHSAMLHLEYSEFVLQEVLDESIRSVAALSAERPVQVTVQPTEAVMYADRHRLGQIVTNLLIHAIDVSAPGSEVTVWVTDSESFTGVHIRDNGTAIPPHLRGAMFDRFRQIADSSETTPGSSAFGLFICKSLVELHGGKIEVHCEGERSNTFSFSIPHGSVVSSVRSSMRRDA